LILLGLVALGLAPGTFLRTDPVENLRNTLQAERLEPPRTTTGPFAIEGIWRLTSPNSHFGGFSALIAPRDGELVAISDRGRWMRFAPPATGAVPVRFGALGGEIEPEKRAVDAEAAAHDRESGTTWIAFERSNSIERHRDSRFVGADRAEPAAMADWPGNSGAEAIARLPDGRFLVLGEGSPDWLGAGYPGLLLAGDPIDGTRPIVFDFMAPEGYRATDAAALPDGRVLILLRRIDWFVPPRFTGALMLADPAAIRAGGEWRGEMLATLGGDLPRDNFEGLAVAPNDDGSLTLWLITDDNTAALQRTLLYKLRWNGLR
jgi:hypothetical protein